MTNLVDVLRQWMEQGRTIMDDARAMREVAEMRHRDVVDLGVSRSDLQRMVRVPRVHRARMESMAMVFGVDPRDIYAERWRNVDAMLACMNCDARTACDAELSDPANASHERCAGFCPNAVLYRQLAAAPAAA